MNPKKNLLRFRFFLVISGVVVVSCSQKSEITNPSQDVAGISWTNMLSQYRGTILTGSWMQAQTHWNQLQNKIILTGATGSEDVKTWLRFQVEVLEQTRTDGLKEELQVVAVQEFSSYPEVGFAYVPWLKAGLATNLFSRGEVSQKAKGVIEDLEKSPRVPK